MTLLVLGKKCENAVDLYDFLNREGVSFSLSKYESDKFESVFIETFCKKIHRRKGREPPFLRW